MRHGGLQRRAGQLSDPSFQWSGSRAAHDHYYVGAARLSTQQQMFGLITSQSSFPPAPSRGVGWVVGVGGRVGGADRHPLRPPHPPTAHTVPN